MQQGPFAPRALPRFNATTDPAATVSSSTVFPGASGYAVYLAPSISRRDEDGFSSCLACPCHRAVPTTPPQGCASSDSLATHPVTFVRHEKTRPLGFRPSGLSTRWRCCELPASGRVRLRPEPETHRK